MYMRSPGRVAFALAFPATRAPIDLQLLTIICVRPFSDVSDTCSLGKRSEIDELKIMQSRDRVGFPSISTKVGLVIH